MVGEVVGERRAGVWFAALIVSSLVSTRAHARGPAHTQDFTELPPAEPHLRLNEPLVQGQKANWEVPVWHSLGLMTGMRLSEAWLWPDPFAETDLDVIGGHYVDAFTLPPKWDSRERAFEWDGDPWWINAVGHPLFGSELYYRPRRCGHGVLSSLLIATAGSTLWEYGYEASGVRPSGLDLWFTPLTGVLLGEFRYWGYDAGRAIDDPVLRGIVATALDPFGELERAFGAPC